MNVRLLTALASALMAETVRVQVLDVGAAELGTAGYDGKSYTIGLRADVGDGQVLGVLFHELGHLACGHVPRRVTSPLPRDGSLLAVLEAEAMAKHAAEYARQEAEATAWADARMATLGPNAVRVLGLALTTEMGRRPTSAG